MVASNLTRLVNYRLLDHRCILSFANMIMPHSTLFFCLHLCLHFNLDYYNRSTKQSPTSSRSCLRSWTCNDEEFVSAESTL
jgi:hypothetical protein